MRIVFCSSPLDPASPDPDFQAEASAAEALGIEFVLVDFEALVNGGDPNAAVRRIRRAASDTTAVYRGWMLKPEQYAQLFDALAGRGLRLVNDLAAYRHCHHLPEWYPGFTGLTPRSVWLAVSGEPPMERIREMLRPFGNGAVIVKDYVKSRKHEWNEACYIPSAADGADVERVVRRFLELQDEDLNEGLVFREFVRFLPIGVHPKSGMPLTNEYRLFFLDGEVILHAPYWDEQHASRLDDTTVAKFAALAGRIQSRFFSMDVAQLIDGTWMIVELGDGQVAGLPPRADVRQFYAGLQRH